jgi:hypothetical protein
MSRLPIVRSGSFLVIAAVSLIGSGCGDRLPPVFQVTGRVVFKDGRGDVRRLKGQTVQFQSLTDAEDMPGAAIEDDGRFTLHSVRGTKVVSGIKEGKYKARIFFAGAENPEHPKGNLVDPRYLSFKTTPLEFTIMPGENNITVEIESGH